jgi:hypothetical protein
LALFAERGAQVTTANVPAQQHVLPHAWSRWGEAVRTVLLACGPASAILYIVWNELAALQWESYSRISNAISELSLTGAPSQAIMEPLGYIYNPLLAAFGVGVWLSAGGKRSLQAVGAFFVLSAATWPLWLLFGDAGLWLHIAVGVVNLVGWFGAMAFSAIAFKGWFRVYAIVTTVAVALFWVPVFGYAPAIAAGEPTPFIGLFERLAFTAHFLWTIVLAVVLWSRPPWRSGKSG